MTFSLSPRASRSTGMALRDFQRPWLILLLEFRRFIPMTLVIKFGMTSKVYVPVMLYLLSLQESSNVLEVKVDPRSTIPFVNSKLHLAPQKIMWMAWDRYRKTNRGENINVDFYTGMPTMFSVKKYSNALDALRVQRGVGGHFQHNLIAIDSANHKAQFKKADGTMVDVDYTTLHVAPPMGPLDFLKCSPIVDSTGWVQVNQSTLRHVNPEFGNIFALGDCSSLPTSKTTAAITAQAPVVAENVFSVVDSGKVGNATYDGYTSCPVSHICIIGSYLELTWFIASDWIR
jgi:hypothetical protein